MRNAFGFLLRNAGGGIPTGPVAGDADEALLDSYSRAVVDAVDSVALPSCMSRSPAFARGGAPMARGRASSLARRAHLTNNHVIDGAREIAISTSDGRKFGARALGRDPDTDLAVLRGETGDAARGASPIQAVRPGQIAIAIGNPLSSRRLRPACQRVGRCCAPRTAGSSGIIQRRALTDPVACQFRGR
ncbi:MAG: S1C family serine protease [Xanthobacteraceae bacterium]|nr:S1C family serine protease [Xanthobacteraceae bacterium]